MAKYIGIGVLVLALVGAGAYFYMTRWKVPEMVDVGVPHYPGAKDINADTFSSRLSPRDRARLIKAVIFETDDAPDKVIAFYRANLKEKTEIFEKKTRGVPGAVIRTEVNGKARLILITYNEDTNKTQISIGEITDKMPKP